ncbi:N-succinylarginine dihydrolase [Pseudoalteromonas luteoviolacea]|uniref:N-succinylarginine dihydrolase n=1 Tax=Pseudoalteromonas luteoviolacea S4054 TaxID=1129367 RepID=A0A0F6AB21_9GAMM|nr:N-succinylarginine dihydrolase [Pseudoalteromonas luteoviolacea]AOT08599.1 succinylarginine dihydrolase [Pseudoalteromonas luteoviolacea]AOT13515.1 succinylarginine dihydrolase [Pseudoalteromonas luteoviolacea]AOT18428.1 succinylarginine dihydrolase [Pseudoalteromonas luteoviolacea]KKE83402.1 succinylarginine dihydrolase [Pseudoalteromonas luteoviolacea S4054]KZN75839.1 succinylarginine dihydrolase [Pseudoalteromonas luteoviolacea S4047-1]
MNFYEVNFDGLVGPSHNYAGLSYGNVASKANAKKFSNPKQAALQGLDKMFALAQLGLHQGVLAPNARPDLKTLRALGFGGSDADVIAKAAKAEPQLLKACYSASSMWTANAATVSPSCDTEDRKVHFTPANLNNKLHRAIEVETTARILKQVFHDKDYFAHHEPLPQHPLFGDEGAANHTRLADSYNHSGLAVFVYGQDNQSDIRPSKFPARQTRQASEAVARSHLLKPENSLFIQQNPDVIDAGVFHNDVIAIGNENVFLFHEQAFYDQQTSVRKIREAYSGSRPLHLIEVSSADVTVEQAVQSYIFNSQLVSLPNGGMALIAPSECQKINAVETYLSTLKEASNPVNDVIYLDVKQSMQNGGGPACLRLRVVLSELELKAANQACLLDEQLYSKLSAWISKHYRDQLSEYDLADYQLLLESYSALDELTQILQLGSVYDFQIG